MSRDNQRNTETNLNPISDKALNINPYAYMGVNLSHIHEGNREQAFINIFKTAREWITQNKTAWDTKESNRLNIDANGYVRSLTPLGGGKANFTYVGTKLNNGIGPYTAGKYVVLYQGEGTLEYLQDAKKDIAASKPGRDVIDINPSNSGIYIKLTSTDPKKIGNYLRNIRIVPLAAEKTFEKDVLNPAFVQKFKNFRNFRFMHWMETTDSTQKNWVDRPTPNTATYNTDKGASLESMVALANKTNADPWFTIPHLATDDYVRRFATYVRNNLKPNLKVYVEYSNEVWNGLYKQNAYSREQGKKLFPQLDAVTAGWDFYSMRTTQVTRIWDQVYGANKSRVIGVLAGQGSNIRVLQRAVSYAWAGKNKPTNQAMGIDAIAIAPYFGYHLGTPQYTAQVTSWTKDPDGGLSKLFRELTQGGVLQGGIAQAQGSGLKIASDRIKAHAALAKTNGLQLLGYEGGQHLATVPGTYGNKTLENLFIKANKDPRMGSVYKQYWRDWNKAGGGLMSHFSSVTPYNSSGSWGLLETLSQNSSPKYNALMDLLQGRY